MNPDRNLRHKPLRKKPLRPLEEMVEEFMGKVDKSLDELQFYKVQGVAWEYSKRNAVEASFREIS